MLFVSTETVFGIDSTGCYCLACEEEELGGHCPICKEVLIDYGVEDHEKFETRMNSFTLVIVQLATYHCAKLAAAIQRPAVVVTTTPAGSAFASVVLVPGMDTTTTRTRTIALDLKTDYSSVAAKSFDDAEEEESRSTELSKEELEFEEENSGMFDDTEEEESGSAKLSKEASEFEDENSDTGIMKD
ncbi:hypothetical protein HK102_008568 [Quaeritorhiza haematococci]|nr:hypothetical protein HK102_008568 [Quaeritorhiza haematococci]